MQDLSESVWQEDTATETVLVQFTSHNRFALTPLSCNRICTSTGSAVSKRRFTRSFISKSCMKAAVHVNYFIASNKVTHSCIRFVHRLQVQSVAASTTLRSQVTMFNELLIRDSKNRNVCPDECVYPCYFGDGGVLQIFHATHVDLTSDECDTSPNQLSVAIYLVLHSTNDKTFATSPRELTYSYPDACTHAINQPHPHSDNRPG